MIDPN